MEIYGKPISKIWGEPKTLNEYSCGWCGYKFKQYVGKGGKQGEGKKGNISDQVRCKQCNNFIKSW